MGADDGTPGILKSIAVMLPPVIDEQYTATRNTIAGTGCIEYVNGRPSATAIVALTPGSAPKIVPTTMANTTINNV